MQKLINTVKQVSTRTFSVISLVFSAHIFFYIYLVQILSRLSSTASSLCSSSAIWGVNVIGDYRRFVIVLSLILAFPLDITLPRKKCKRKKTRAGIVTCSDIINHSSVMLYI